MRASILPFLMAGTLVSGCATKRYVTREVGEVDTKVDGLSGQMEATQERVKRNEQRIDETGARADAGIREANGAAKQAMSKATDAEKAAKGKLIYEVTLSNDKVTFPRNQAEISDDARKVIDEAVEPLKAENKGVYFEIEGHTDSTGPQDFNRTLGEQRAVAVRNYLHDQVGIALNRMQVISYGASEPVVANDTSEHRAQNRRVVIKALE
jgi:outer membrane protein OmpA-like peptidoglycan-associated protein